MSMGRIAAFIGKLERNNMIKILLLTTIFSCATTNFRETNQDKKEPAACKNTLQHDIHRDQCMR